MVLLQFFSGTTALWLLTVHSFTQLVEECCVLIGCAFFFRPLSSVLSAVVCWDAVTCQTCVLSSTDFEDLHMTESHMKKVVYWSVHGH